MKFSTITDGLPYWKIFWIGLGTVVIALLFIFQTPNPYKYVETVNAEVISVRVLSPQPPQESWVKIRFDDGTQTTIKAPTSRVILKGTFIAVNRFELGDKDPIYRLAQSTTTP